jgi:ankyrin repeat protein
VNKSLREAFGYLLDDYEDLQKRGFSCLHRIIFGLSNIDLETALALSTANIDAQCSLGRTPLCWAAVRRDPAHVRSLIKYGAALHLADCRGQLPFHFAAGRGTAESLKILLATAARMTGPNSRIDTSRAIAEDGDDKDGADPPNISAYCLSLIETRDYKGRTPLHFASRINQVAQTNLLLLYGADINSPDSVLNRSPLLLTIYWNNHEVMSLLLARKARTDIVDARKMTILHYVAKFGDAKTLRILSEAGIEGVSPDCRNMEGRTPMEVFDELRPSCLVEDSIMLAKSRVAFENLLMSLHPPGSQEPTSSEPDIFFDALSSLEIS